MTEEPEPSEGDEPETGDPVEIPDEEHEPEQTPAQAAAAAGSDELLKRADKENQRYQKAIAKILGDDPNRHECPRCEGLGLVWGEEEQMPEMKVAEDSEVCESCNGWGQTITGAVNPQQSTKPCGDCGGRGWRNVIRPVAPVAQLPAASPAAPVAPSPQPLAGQWVPGRGFIPYGATEPVVPDLGAGQQ